MAWWEDPARELGLALVGMRHQPGSRNHHLPAADPSGLGPEAASLPCSVGLAFGGENGTLLLVGSLVTSAFSESLPPHAASHLLT